MDNDRRAPNPNPQQSSSAEQSSFVPYRRTVHHVTQEPITDDGTAYRRQAQNPTARGAASSGQTSQYGAPGRSGSRRKHMGVATSDAQYLQPVDSNATKPGRPAHPRHKSPGDGTPQTLRSNRYLSTPPGRKAIFTARQNKARRRMRILVVLALVTILAIVVWVLLFH